MSKYIEAEWLIARIPSEEMIARLMVLSKAPTIDIVFCNKCEYYKGIHGVKGNAPCEFWNAMVMWDWYCVQGKEVDNESD